jgi:hypothetical protein
MNDKLGKMWKELVVAYFKVVFLYFSGRIEDNDIRIDGLWAGI